MTLHHKVTGEDDDLTLRGSIAARLLKVNGAEGGGHACDSSGRSGDVLRVRDALAVIDGISEPRAVTIHGQLVHNEIVQSRLESRGFALAG